MLSTRNSSWWPYILQLKHCTSPFFTWCWNVISFISTPCSTVYLLHSLHIIWHQSLLFSCIDFRNSSGLNKESWAVDYGGGLNMLQALEILSKQNGQKNTGTKPRKSQFVLLSAFCCGKPVLQFQFAKLKLEESIRKTSETFEDITHSIVRPTAYFKSLDGQIESAKKGIQMWFPFPHCSWWW